MLPSTLKEIGDDAFHFCMSLVAVEFSEGLERILAKGQWTGNVGRTNRPVNYCSKLGMSLLPLLLGE
jgi:hypothetical protein